LNYQMPPAAAAGPARVVITAGGTSVTGTVNIAATYPNLFKLTADNLAAAQIVRVRNGQQSVEEIARADSSGQFVAVPVAVGSDQVFLVLYGTGIGTAATATLNGADAAVSYSGPQGAYPGLDQVNLLIPASLAGKGRVSVTVTAAGKPSNIVY